MDDERLKNPAMMNYFDELLQRIREVRASEKLFYQKVKDIYVNSVDYDKHSQQAQVFFKTVQNKMLYAVTGMTAVELLLKRSNSDLPNMGLTSWDGGKVSHDRAEELAHERYAVFDRQRREEEAQRAEQEAAEEFKQLEKEVVKRKVSKMKTSGFQAK